MLLTFSVDNKFYVAGCFDVRESEGYRLWMLVRLPVSFLRLLIRFILFSFSRSNADGTFSGCYVSAIGLDFGKVLAEADDERTAAG